jgi:hypothetical protein
VGQLSHKKWLKGKEALRGLEATLCFLFPGASAARPGIVGFAFLPEPDASWRIRGHSQAVRGFITDGSWVERGYS